jgi:hypothetical protein
MGFDLSMPDDNLVNRREFIDAPLHFSIESSNLPICLRMLDSGDNMLDSMKIEELLEGMLSYFTFACRYKLCAMVGENLPGIPYRANPVSRTRIVFQVVGESNTPWQVTSLDAPGQWEEALVRYDEALTH